MPFLLLLAACENAPVKKAEQTMTATVSSETSLDREIKSLLEKGISMSERKRQVAAIEVMFRRHTTPEEPANWQHSASPRHSAHLFSPLTWRKSLLRKQEVTNCPAPLYQTRVH